MKNQSHLPRYGVGPYYVAAIITLTVFGILLVRNGTLQSGSVPQMRMVFSIAGGILVLLGNYIWIAAIFQSKIADNIYSNKLITTGIYAHVRNPIYSGIAIFLTGILLFAHNLWLLLLPPVFWASETILMLCTEEKWLLELYGEEYADYCKRVNRCIPWF